MCRRKPDEHGNIFTEEEIENIRQLTIILKQIRARLISEGIDVDAEFEKKFGINKKATPPEEVK